MLTLPADTQSSATYMKASPFAVSKLGRLFLQPVNHLSGAGRWCCWCRRCGCSRRRCMALCIEMLLAQTAVSTRFAALFGSTSLVTRLRHLASLPQPVMFSAIAFADNLAGTIARLASSLFSHLSPIQHSSACGFLNRYGRLWRPALNLQRPTILQVNFCSAGLIARSTSRVTVREVAHSTS